MTEGQPVIHVSTPAVAVVSVMLLGTLIVLASIQPPVAILLVIFGFIFGDNLLRYVTTTVDSDTQSGADYESATADAEPGDALERLRIRYADGELSETEFERRLEVLLETETVADVERYLEIEDSRPDGDGPETDVDRELERSSG